MDDRDLPPEIRKFLTNTSRLLTMLSVVREQVEVERVDQGSVVLEGWITHYGERFNERMLGCHGYGRYSSDDPTIIAVNPALYDKLPCGSILELCGPGGCLVAARKDSCPGCRPDGFDLSEAGFRKVCGDGDGVCTASVRVMKVCEKRSFGKAKDQAPQAPDAGDAFPPRVACQHPPF